MSGEVLENCVTAQGVHWLHVVSMGKPVERAAWVKRVCRYCLPVEYAERYEKGLDVHHLQMWWLAREMMTIDCGAAWLDGMEVLVWMLDRGQSLREGLIYAGIAYVDLTDGRLPATALVGKIPSGATEWVAIYEDGDERREVRLLELPGLPKGMLILTEACPERNDDERSN
ncbi:MAG: hypothetical protein AB1453_12090 [Chloroflexota bacterium]